MEERGTARHVAAIYNAAYMVRYYVRGGRLSIQRAERAAAIRALGLVCRRAFNECDDYEAVLSAIYDGLSPKEARF